MRTGVESHGVSSGGCSEDVASPCDGGNMRSGYEPLLGVREIFIKALGEIS